MTVSTSKFTFSLIAIAALLVSGSGFMIQDAYATTADAPEFTAVHYNTTATIVTFDANVNGTLRILDWAIMKHTCIDPCLDNSANEVDGERLTQVAITDVRNGTTSGFMELRTATYGAGDIRGGEWAAGLTTSYGGPGPSAKDIIQSGGGATLGFMNNTDTLVLIHAALDTNNRYFINYTNNQNTADVFADGAIHEYVVGGLLTAGAVDKRVKVGSNTTAAEWMPPTVVSASISKSNAKQVNILMSEPIGNINSTATGFSITRTHGTGYDAVPSVMVASNGTNYIEITLQNAAKAGDVLSVAYSSGHTNWITDAIDTTRYTTSGATDTAIHLETGFGNRLLNFTGLAITNWLQIGQYGDVTTCYDCNAPTVTDVQVSLDSSIPIKVTNDNQVHINAGIDDTVTVMVTLADNLGADTIPFAGLYTNFGDTPDNLFYANNFDSAKKMSTSYYEWNVRDTDIAFDNNGDITWTDATAKVNPDRTQTFTYTMTINDEIESSQVWIDVADKVGNYAKIALPITLEVSGAPGLTFASDDTQKVVSFFNESILLAIVSQWASASSDDASNVEQLSSVLGIENQLPTWTTDLASWVADDKIDVADMIVAVEYVINQ